MLTPLAELRDPEATTAAHAALAFLRGHRWCGTIERADVAFAIPGVIVVMQVDVVPNEPGADHRVWLVGGDLPPAYLVWDETDTWQDALRGYIYEMQRWVTAAQTGQSVDELIPVNVSPTKEYAAMLEGRLAFIERELLSRGPDDYESAR